MNKNISTIIQEMKHHRDDFMKRSTPYRQLNRAIKQLEKLEKIEQIVNEWNNDASHSFEDMCKINKILNDN